MDSEYNVNAMSSINVGSELQEDEEEQFAVLNLHMDSHRHQYSPVVPDLYSFDPTVSPPNLLMIEPTFGGNNSNNSDASSPVYCTAADQSHLLQCADEGLIDICTAAKSDCNEALSGTPTSSSTPTEYPENQVGANSKSAIPGAAAGINNIAMNPAAPALNNHNMQAADNTSSDCSGRDNPTAAMREMIFRVAAMQPIHIDPESIKRPKRRNVRISEHPQSVAARHRRERISERIRILQRLVPGGTRMDTASMLDEAIHYVKFLKTQVQTLQSAGRGGCTRCSFNNNYWLGLPNYAAVNPNYADEDAVFPNNFLMAESRAYNNNNNCSLS